ncbi:MAG: hypothetical protein ABI995_01050 [Acidobacteriota bacterium]
MISPLRGQPLEFSLPAAGAASKAGANALPTSLDSVPSFAQQLATAIEGYLGQGSKGGHLKIDISAGGSQGSGSRQFVVTVTDPDAAASAPDAKALIAARATPAPAPVFGGMMYSGTVEASAQPVKPVQETVAPPITNETDAYWATQPKEVQVLRTIDDLGARVQKGKELAQKGFLVDYDIMIWRQDPFMTMHIREGEGYTWTPSMGQPGTSLPAGIEFPGMSGYDAKHPLAGAIRVTTDFAKGLENTSPWWSKSPTNG